MDKLRHFIPFVFLCLMISSNSAFGQKRILDRAKKAIYQFDYQDAQNELKLYLQKNDNQANNLFYLISARCYGDPESPYFDLDTAYKIVSLADYQTTAFDPKMDVVICKSFEACTDTVENRKNMYASMIFHQAMDKNEVDALNAFIRKYGHHELLKSKAISAIHTMEYEKAKKGNRILHYSNFIEKYPDAEQVKLAKAELDKLRFERVKRVHKVREYEIFLEKYPESVYTAEVVELIEKARWEYCIRAESVYRYQEYLNHYPNSSHKAEAQSIIEKLQWKQILLRNEVAYYRWFIRTYPSSEHNGMAISKLFEASWSRARETSTIESYQRFILEYPNTTEARLAREAIDVILLELIDEIESETPLLLNNLYE